MTKQCSNTRFGPLRLACILSLVMSSPAAAQGIGSERAIANHLLAGEEMTLSTSDLLVHGRALFTSKFTREDGHGRPLRKGDFSPLSDPLSPLVFPRNMNRISSPEATSCAGCHMDPRPGGGGEFLTNAFVLAERFDHATFDPLDLVSTKGAKDELGVSVTLDTIGNTRSTPHLFGSGYVEMIARQITLDLQAQRNSLASGASAALMSKGISFGWLVRDGAGNWDTSGVVGLPAASLVTTGPSDPPSLLLRPFSHGAATVSLRHFTNNAFHHHLGIEPLERVGEGVDDDGDGVTDELTRGDVTAAVIFQATLPPPGRVLPANKDARDAVARGEDVFVAIGCATCHVPCLPLTSSKGAKSGFAFSEPSPFNGPGNWQQGDAYHSEFGSLVVDLLDPKLPTPRLKPAAADVIEVPLFSDLRVHDLTDGPADPNREPLDMQRAPGSQEFFAGNGRFITPRLWGVGSSSPYFHHGKFTTLREAIEAHGGEASTVRSNWHGLAEADRASLVEFLKSLRILPEGAKSLVIDAKGKKAKWHAFPWTCGQVVPPVPSGP